VISFGSLKEYNAYRIRPSAAAFFVGTEARDYVVMPAARSKELSLAAHEYAHVLLHQVQLKLPEWVSEGIADVFSTARIGEHTSSIGGDLPERSRTLRRKWIPLAGILTSAAHDRRDDLFYAQSWALVDMLLFSPHYAERVPALFQALSSRREDAGGAMEDVYARPLAAIERDLRGWTASGASKPVPLPGARAVPQASEISEVTSFQARSMLADLRLACGDLPGARLMFQQLQRESPRTPEIPAALGVIALRSGDTGGALQAWKSAVALGLRDAGLCYRYASLAETAGLPADQIRPALERAVALRPDFDDARYRLALMEKNAGNLQAALAQFLAVRKTPANRAHAHWMSLADTLLQLDRRAEARAAALRAREHGATAEERQNAAQLVLMAETDLGVQLLSDSQGRAQWRAVRVPQRTAAWNPFIESGDRIQRVSGTLAGIDCSPAGLRLDLSTGGGRLTLLLPDPSRVQIRNAPGGSFEFVCGAQPPTPVMVEYAVSERLSPAAGIVRGIELR
jgi:tetratricopeptide (TPR) repeat protein